MGLQS